MTTDEWLDRQLNLVIDQKRLSLMPLINCEPGRICEIRNEVDEEDLESLRHHFNSRNLR